MEIFSYPFEWKHSQTPTLEEVTEAIEAELGYSVFYISYSLEDVVDAIKEDIEAAEALGVDIYFIEGLDIYVAF